MTGNRHSFQRTFTARNSENIKLYLGKISSLKLHPYKNSSFIDFIARCLYMSSYFWSKHDRSWEWWQLKGKKKYERNGLVKYRDHKRALGGWWSWLSIFNLKRNGKRSTLLHFRVLLVPRQCFKWLIENSWCLFISMEAWGLICNSITNTLHELQKQITLHCGQVLCM